MTDELEEMARNCKWDLGNEPPVGDPRNKDFIEADVKKIVDALRTLRSKTRKEDATIVEKFMNGHGTHILHYHDKEGRTSEEIVIHKARFQEVAQAILKKEESEQ